MGNVRNSRFQRGTGVYSCHVCGRKTRSTGDNGQSELCPQCYELAGYENSLSDNGIAQCREWGEGPAVLALVNELERKGGDIKQWTDLVLTWTAPAAPAAPAVEEPIPTFYEIEVVETIVRTVRVQGVTQADARRKARILAEAGSYTKLDSKWVVRSAKEVK